jgi:hypothetical protein
MRHYSEITTQLEMDALLARVAGFHDAMAKELHLSNRGWVGPDRSMMMSHRFDARLLVQSQWDPVAIELLFIGIETLSADDPGEYWGASGVIELQTAPVEKRRVCITFDSTLSITAERLSFVDRPTWTGPRSRFGTEVPHPDCVPAIRVVDQWRQCSSCSDAFEAPPDVFYCLCSGCGAMTELEDESSQRADAADGATGRR